MPSRKARTGAASRSVASIPNEFMGKKAHTAGERPAQSKDSDTSETSSRIRSLILDKVHPTLPPQNAGAASPISASTHRNTAPNINCAVCTSIGRVLACCLSLEGTNSCRDCADMALLLAQVAPDPQHDRQLKEDSIESLKIDVKQFEAETERLKEILAEKKKVLQEKRDDLYKKKPEGPKILKRLGRAKAAKKKAK